MGIRWNLFWGTRITRITRIILGPRIGRINNVCRTLSLLLCWFNVLCKHVHNVIDSPHHHHQWWRTNMDLRTITMTMRWRLRWRYTCGEHELPEIIHEWGHELSGLSFDHGFDGLNGWAREYSLIFLLWNTNCSNNLTYSWFGRFVFDLNTYILWSFIEHGLICFILEH